MIIVISGKTVQRVFKNNSCGSFKFFLLYGKYYAISLWFYVFVNQWSRYFICLRFSISSKMIRLQVCGFSINHSNKNNYLSIIWNCDDIHPSCFYQSRCVPSCWFIVNDKNQVAIWFSFDSHFTLCCKVDTCSNQKNCQNLRGPILEDLFVSARQYRYELMCQSHAYDKQNDKSTDARIFGCWIPLQEYSTINYLIFICGSLKFINNWLKPLGDNIEWHFCAFQDKMKGLFIKNY